MSNCPIFWDATATRDDDAQVARGWGRMHLRLDGGGDNHLSTGIVQADPREL